MFNPWRQFRLMGAIVLLVNYFVHSLSLLGVGILLVGIGMLNGLESLERRVEKLEKERSHDETEA